MAYTTNAPSTSGADFASDVIGGVNYPIVKIAHGTAGTASDIDGTSGLPVSIVAQTQALVVSDGGNSLTIDGSVAVTSALEVSDGGGSLTVDNATLTSLANAINSNRVDINIAASALQSSTKSDVSSYTSANDVMTLIGGYDGTNARAIGVDTSRNVKVSIEADNVGISGGIQYSANELYTGGDAGNILLAVQKATDAAIVSEGRYSPIQVDATGSLKVDFPNVVVDANNSTTSPLTSNTDYTGTWTDISKYAAITVNIFADQNSDANGMKFQFSSDGSNADIDKAGGFDYVANTGRTFQFGTQAQYFRVVFQNAGQTQTTFRLQTLLHHHAQALMSIHRADSNIAVDRSASLVKSILMAQAAGSGDFIPIDATAGGNLKVAIEENDAGNITVNQAQISGTATSVGNGTTDSGTQRVTISSDSTGVVSTSGNVAHDATDSGNPIKIGAKVNTTPSASTVSDDDRTDLFADADGYQLVRGAAHGDLVNGVANTTSVTDTVVIAAGGANIKQYITDAIIANTSATNITVDVKDGSTTKATFPVPANSGVVHSFGSPIGGTANTAWTFSPSVNATTVTCTLSGYKSRV